MILLYLSAGICALATLALNAHYGWTSSAVLEYAVVMTALSIAFDLAKSTLLPAMVIAWRRRAPVTAVLCFLLFWPCLGYSLYAGLSQVAKDRDVARAGLVSNGEAREHTEALHKRLSAELATMLSAPTWEATSACTLPRSSTARAYCEKVAATKRDIADAEAKLAGLSPISADPQLKLLAAVLAVPVPTLQLGVTFAPVVLAEIVGSLGFFIAALLGKASSEPASAPQKRFAGLRRAWWRRTPKTQPEARPEASPAGAGSPQLVWSTSTSKG